MTTLRDRAILVSLHTGSWLARKLDRKATATLTFAHGITDGAARVNKNLLPGADELAEIEKAASATRAYHYSQTLPWALDGVGILPTSRYFDYTQEIQRLTALWRGAVDGFLEVYPRLRDEARLQLNGLYNEDDYPPTERLRTKFRLETQFFPIPEAADFRADLDAEHIAYLQERARAQEKAALADAMRSAWERLHQVVERAVERLSDPEAVFRNSLVENAQVICETLQHLNILGDPDLEEARAKVERALCGHNPDTLRKNPRVRADTARELQHVLDTMGVFFPKAA